MIVRIAKLLLLFLVMTLVVAISVYLTFALLVKGEDTVVVPDLTGRNVVYCLELLTDLGLDIKVRDLRYDDRIPKHHVLYQDPDPGTQLKKGRDVQIVLSRGRQQIFMPDVRNLSLEQARLIVEENELRPGAISKTCSGDYRKDQVMAQYPPAGATINKGVGVDLLISHGRRPRSFIMPRLEGLTLAAAIFQLESFGLQPGKISSRLSPEKTENTVLVQEPLPGSRISENDRVDLVINREAGRRPSLLLRGDGGVRLFRYRLEKGMLNRHIKITMNCLGMSIDLYDQYRKPDTELWVLIPAFRDVTLLLYEDHELVDTVIYSGWEQ